RLTVDDQAAALGAPERLGQPGLDEAGAEAVDLDVVLGPPDGHDLGRLGEGALGQPVDRDRVEPDRDVDRPDVDDLAAALGGHAGRDSLAQEVGLAQVGVHYLVV